MEMIHRKAYEFWLKELRKHTSDIHRLAREVLLFKELFDNEYRLKEISMSNAKLGYVDSYFRNLAIWQQEGADDIQLFPFVMIDRITSLLAAVHIEEGDRVRISK